MIAVLGLSATRTSRWLASGIAASLATWLVAGCSVCDIDCRDSFFIEIVSGQSSFPNGDYSVSVQAELESAEITCTVPTTGCGCQTNNPKILACIDGGTLSVSIEGKPVWADVVLSTGGLDLVNDQFTADYRSAGACGRECWHAHAKRTP